ncbi:efflux RND transporter periplasmic adaptor subunit [Stenotrophobium rhamnosiphilum]|nr:efflux RND transporter periplasmic adaptor subunit [Stenotrophobium rhamnosiphilum]
MNSIIVKAALFSTVLLLAACGKSPSDEASHGEHADGEAAHAEEIIKGPHGGRLLKDGDFSLEVTIFENGVPPEFRLYPSVGGKPIALKDVQASTTLRRVNGMQNGISDQHVFAPKEDYLRSDVVVYEPHSFDVTVKATHAGKVHSWNYASPEGQVRIATDMATAAGLKTAVIGGGALHETLALYGSIQANPERMRAVTARFPGIVRSVSVKVGDTVRQGQALATVESNESLQVYTVTAPISGTLTARNTNHGEAAGTEALFEIADFSSVRAELSVFPRDRTRLQPGQSVTIKAADGVAQGTGVIGFVSPVGAANQALSARVVLDNSKGEWTPGQFVNADVTVGESNAALIVPLSALQTFRDWDVVFVNEGDRYQAQPVKLGRRDSDSAEVLSGLAAGARVVVANSYLVKADIEKSGASHDH